MHKRGALLILLVLSLCTASASTISEEMQRLTHYAEEYETGNVNYLQLMVHISAVKEGLNELMGVKSKEEGGILKQEQLKSILGDPAEETKWVWVEKEEREMKLGNSVPIWKKIVFDGKKIQVRLAAYPSILQKKDLSSAKSEKLETFEDLGDGKYLAYRLNFETEFKKEGQQLNVQEKIEDIKALAGTYNADPSQANGEALAKESVNVEKSFESYFRQSGEKCEDILASIFGSENKRKLEKMIVWEIDFYEGDNFLARTRLEMCDECGGNWINLDTWIEGRGPGFKGIEGTMESSSPDEFMTLSDESFEAKTRELLEDSKRAIEKKEWPEFNRIKSRIWSLNEAWNRKSNDVWKEIDAVYEEERKSMSEEERRKFEENYGWLKQEQEKRAKVKETQTANYQKRKAFYESLFSSYEKKEYFYEQVGFEKRLIEEFREFGEEVCDNNQDDNNNGNIDCADEQCGGKICGYSTVAIAGSNNETHEEEKEMYCIMGSCQVKEEIIEMKNESICGNHLCELGEKESNCTQDCAMCPTYDPINCSGKVIFSGKDENGCPLEPVCVEEDSCTTDEDCKFLCGLGSCVE